MTSATCASPESPITASAAPDSDDVATSVWIALKTAASVAVRAVCTAGRTTAKATAYALDHIDRDARRHLGELPWMAVSSLGPRVRSVEPQDDDGHRPIVYVHGLAGHPGNFAFLRGYLSLNGRSRAYTVSLAGADGFDEMADRVRATVAQVIAVNQLPEDAKVDVIAHSMGGVVSRVALDDAATRARVATLITLGSPHDGTVLARFVGTAAKNALELRRDSVTMSRLKMQVPWRREDEEWPELISFWSPNDMLLMPATCAKVDGATNVECPEYTHFTWLLHPRGWRHVFGALNASSMGTRYEPVVPRAATASA